MAVAQTMVRKMTNVTSSCRLAGQKAITTDCSLFFATKHALWWVTFVVPQANYLLSLLWNEINENALSIDHFRYHFG